MFSASSYLPVAQAGVPLLFWGPPGSGKSAAVHAWAAARNLRVEVLIGSLSDSADVLGFAVRSDSPEGGVSIEFALPGWFRRLQSGGVLFLDELNRGPRLVRDALLRVVAERAVHGHKLPDTVAIVAAANADGEVAGLDPAMLSRFAHLEWKVDARAWSSQSRTAQWDAPSELPAEWEASLPLQRDLVATFIEARPELLTTPADADVTRGSPSPRTWTLAARALAACSSLGLSPAPLLTGLVGDGPAKEFSAWLRTMDLPAPEDVLAGRWKADGTRDRQRAALLSILPLVVDSETWSAAWKQIDRVRKDIAALVAPLLAVRRPEGAPAPASAGKLMKVLQ